MNRMTCETCKWWEDKQFPADSHGRDIGRCRRHAPRYHHDDNCVVDWPATTKRDWCGEYTPLTAEDR